MKTIPPLLMGGTRFITAGFLLFLWTSIKEKSSITKNDWMQNVFAGLLLIFGGLGSILWVQQTLSTSVVSIFVASMPIWITLFDFRNWKNTLRDIKSVAGLLIGFSGVILLISVRQDGDTINSSVLFSFFILIAGNICWALGSLYSRNKSPSISFFKRVSIQMIAGGIACMILGIALGEWKELHFSAITTGSILGLAYLILFGSLIGYLSYIWLLNIRPASQVSTYAYVNPAVAVLLGWLILHENISGSMLIALVIILAGVVLVNISSYRNKV